jgi:hypothetical protein
VVRMIFILLNFKNFSICECTHRLFYVGVSYEEICKIPGNSGSWEVMAGK